MTVPLTSPQLLAAPAVLAENPTLRHRAAWLAAAALTGALAAGFWNVQFVDGLGVSTFVRPTIGHFEGKAAEFAARGAAFGFVFAVVAGLAASWTASNAASLAMLPLLAVAADGRPRAVLRLGVIAAASAAAVGLAYGTFVGRLGPAGAAAFNASAIRSAQSFAVFGTIGVCMVVWAAAEAGLLGRVPVSPATRAFFAQPGVKAACCGLMMGAFTIGRPLATFREFLLYAAQPARPSYGAAVMVLEVLGTLIVPFAALLVVTTVFGARIRQSIAVARPGLLSAAALAGGGTFLLFYWGFSRVWPALGRWGFTLGIYG